MDTGRNGEAAGEQALQKNERMRKSLRKKRPKRKASPVPVSTRVLRSRSPSHDPGGIAAKRTNDIRNAEAMIFGNDEIKKTLRSSKSKRKATRPRKLNVPQIKEEAETVPNEVVEEKVAAEGMGGENQEKLDDELDMKKTIDVNVKQTSQTKTKTRTTFQCDVCNRYLASKASLRKHARIHSGERPYRCQVCSKSFCQSSLLINHVKTHSNVMPYQCSVCGNRYKHKRSMETHKARIHDGIRQPFPCNICGKVFTRKTKLKDHTNWHMGKSPHLCEHCGKRFMSRKTLRTHLLIHEDKKPYPCDFCGKAFRQAHVLKRHITTHTGIKPFRCDACGKQFIHRVYLIRHDCPNGSSFKLEIEKEASTQGSTPVLEPCVPCEICGRCYNASYLKIHMRKHTGENPYRCTLCDMPFSTETLLQTHHDRFHAGVELPYVIPRRDDLLKKESTETLERPSYKCHLCDSSYVDVDALNKHLQTHDSELPFRCEVCGKGFKSRRNVSRHMADAHVDQVRTYRCESCDKVYADEISLAKHTKKHIREISEKHTCKVCGARFNEYQVLLAHLSNHTDDQTDRYEEEDEIYGEYNATFKRRSKKRYSCDACGMLFRRSKHMLRHKCPQKMSSCGEDENDDGIDESINNVDESKAYSEFEDATFLQSPAESCNDSDIDCGILDEIQK